MHTTTPTFSDPVHEIRYRIADLLAQIEVDKDGLDPRIATLALLETAYGAALTFCPSPDRARRHVDTTVQKIHSGNLARPVGAWTHDAAPPVPPVQDRRTTSPASSPLAASSLAGSPLAARVFLAVTVAILSWATVVFLAYRGPLSPWNLLGPLFCTLLALVSAYRFLVSGGYMRPWALFSRQQRLRPL